MIIIHFGTAEFVQNEASKVVSQVPVITIKDGIASVNEPQPYYIMAPDGNDVFIIIDTTGTVTSLADSNAYALITKTEAIYKENESQTRTFSFANIKDFTLDQAKLNKWLATFQKLFAPVMYFFAIAFSYVYRIIQALIYAATGLLFAKGFKTKIEYPALLRLAVVAVTPAIIINTIATIAGVVTCGIWLLYLAIALAYLAFGVKAVSDTQRPMDEPTFGPPIEHLGDQM